MIELVAQAVTDELNNQTWSKPFTAVRSYAEWDIALDESQRNVGTLYCDVVPVTYEAADLEDRGTVLWQNPVDVVFRQLLHKQRDNATIDSLVAFNREVYLHFMQAQRIDSNGYFKRTSQQWITAYGRVDSVTESVLRLQNQWTGVFRLTYGASDGLG